ncbi:MAG: hypothetical protein J6S21_03180, partial [Victivallales bacterium]|nr:hypothetical protein [Victivallales bacterium]
LEVLDASGRLLLTIPGRTEIAGASCFFIPEAAEVISCESVLHPDSALSCTPRLIYLTARDDTDVQIAVACGEREIVDRDRPVEIEKFTVNGRSDAFTVYANDVLAVTEVLCRDEDREDQDHIVTGAYIAVDAGEWRDLTQGQPALSKGQLCRLIPYARYAADWRAFLPDEAAGEVTSPEMEINVMVLNSPPEATSQTAHITIIQEPDGSRTGSCTFTLTDADGAEDLLLSADSISCGWGKLALTLDNGTVTAVFTVSDDIACGESRSESLTFQAGDLGDTGDFSNPVDLTVQVDYTLNPAPVLTPETSEITVSEADGAFELAVAAVDGSVYPAGVSAWEITLPEGWSAEELSADTGSAEQGEWQGSVRFRITTPGYDTITGSPRAESQEFPITVTALDSRSGTLRSSASIAVTVTDSDREPQGSAELLLAANELRHGDTARITGIDGALSDPDGDEITWLHSWQHRTPEMNGFEELCTGTEYAGEAVRKGSLLRAVALPVTAPYSGEKAHTAQSLYAEAAVVNTPPGVPSRYASIFILNEAGAPRSGECSFAVSDADGAADVIVADVQGNPCSEIVTELGRMALQLGDDGVLRIRFMLHDDLDVSGDISENISFQVGDRGNEGALSNSAAMSVRVDYLRNPPPVVRVENASVTIDEVDGDGLPAAFEVAVAASDGTVYPAGVSAWEITLPEGWSAEEISADTGTVQNGSWEG